MVDLAAGLSAGRQTREPYTRPTPLRPWAVHLGCRGGAALVANAPHDDDVLLASVEALVQDHLVPTADTGSGRVWEPGGTEGPNAPKCDGDLPRWSDTSQREAHPLFCRRPVANPPLGDRSPNVDQARVARGSMSQVPVREPRQN